MSHPKIVFIHSLSFITSYSIEKGIETIRNFPHLNFVDFVDFLIFVIAANSGLLFKNQKYSIQIPTINSHFQHKINLAMDFKSQSQSIPSKCTYTIIDAVSLSSLPLVSKRIGKIQTNYKMALSINAENCRFSSGISTENSFLMICASAAPFSKNTTICGGRSGNP